MLNICIALLPIRLQISHLLTGNTRTNAVLIPQYVRCYLMGGQIPLNASIYITMVKMFRCRKEKKQSYRRHRKVAGQAKNVEDKLEAVETLQEVGQQQVTAQDFQTTFDRSLDETKKNLRNLITEAKAEVPQYTNAVKNYEEQALESTAKMVEDFIETQKTVLNSFLDSLSSIL